jgi:tetratricopeptide (TPR) repeat protein
MEGAMFSASNGLVEIVRDYVEAHQLMRRLFARARRGDLRFAELEELVGDDEGSVLYRLKERCHSLFRPRAESSTLAMRREMLFDLAVGSLFHEAMKCRENIYQREFYEPRVRALRSHGDQDADALFRDFEKALGGLTPRLEEGLRECETLLNHTREQLRVLLAEHREKGYVARYLLENRERVEDVFGMALDALLDWIHGGAAEGYDCAGRSYLVSGFFAEAEGAFAEAIARGGKRNELERLSAYARGMAAYLAGDYRRSVEWLGRWIDTADEADARLADLAHAAVSRVGQLALGDDKQRVTADAAALLERLAAVRSELPPAGGTP